jgi:hypothetical protein
MDEGNSLLDQAQTLLDTTFGHYITSIRGRHGHYPNDVKKELLVCCWRKVMSMLNVDKLTTTQQQQTIMAKIEKNPPPLTVEELFTTIQALSQNALLFHTDFLKDVYAMLHPDRYWNKAYKTNNTPGIGHKVILHWLKERDKWGFTPGIAYHYRESFNRVERAFKYLDGKPLDDNYNSDIVAAIETQGYQGETKYFRWMGYENGNIHLEFKRMDLVQKLNAIFGGMNLEK